MDTPALPHPDPQQFTRICGALAYIDQHWREQPSLGDMARAVGLSPAYFDRLFHDWAGLTPKAYVQTLTAAAAKAALRGNRPLLDTAFAVGLSGPARLHDLIVKFEAMSPAEYARMGAGLDIRAGIAASPFGWLLSGETARGVCHLGFVATDDAEAALAALQARWPEARLRWDPESAAALGSRLWHSSDGSRMPLRLLVRGSRFQVKVWQALLEMRRGETASYAQLAQRSGATGASARAVGAAVGANPLAWVIPCHRVLRADGTLGGYRWGPERKRAMLAWERLQAGV